MKSNHLSVIALLVAGLVGCEPDPPSPLPGCATDTGRAPVGAVRSAPCPDDAARVRDEICRDGRWEPNGECRLPHECAPGDEDTLTCGLNRRGRALRVCEDGAWSGSQFCDEVDVCEDGAVENTLGNATCTPCGINGRGVRTQSCITGQWDCGPCQEPDECVDGEREMLRCGDDSPIEQLRACAHGHWTTWSACPPPGECIDGDVRAASCGHNGRGRRRVVCRDGVWLAGGCDDGDTCVDDALDRRRCGLNGNGVQDRRCVDGQWPAWNDAACDDPDACVYGEVQQFECGGGGRLRVRRCLVGQWSQWGPCFAPDPCQGDGDCDTGDWCAPIGICLAPSCQDGIRNGMEAGIDCGEPCQPCPADEVCNGLDDDRNGIVDDRLGLGDRCQPLDAPENCAGTLGCGEDGAVVCLPPPGVRARFDDCDGIDDDCDGTVDEDGADACVEALPGTLRAMCVDGQCLAELCLPGDIDADSDRTNGCEVSACTAESVGADVERLGRACTRPVGDGGARCLGTWGCDLDRMGAPTVVCRVAGAPADEPVACGACADEDFLPAVEACDGADDDCDGAIDEGFGRLGDACGPFDSDCPAGVVVCLADGTGTTCETPPPPADAVETCNALDDDCDGATDEACPGGPNVEAGYCLDDATCAVDRCAPGWADLDDDPANGCEGPIDCPAVGEPCFAPRDADAPLERCGRLGRIRCMLDDGVVSSACIPDDADAALVGGRAEVCNAWDDDCDGIADEDVPSDGPCADGIGACQRGGQLVCVDGAFVCDAVPGEPTDEVCDAVDDDCDGDINDAPAEPCYEGPAETQGVGQCVGGARACVDGTFEACADQVQPSEELCGTGLDEDCDGQADEARCSWACDGDVDTPPCNGCRGVLVPDGMVCVPPGESPRGSWPAEHVSGNFNAYGIDTRPKHRVMISRAYAVERLDVRRSQWLAAEFSEPVTRHDCGEEDCAVIVNWYEAAAWANARSEAEGLPPCYLLGECAGRTGERMVCREAEFVGLDCSGYRLATDAEWERAHRAGMDDMAWRPNAEGMNPWGLAGMNAGYSKWVHDLWHVYDQLWAPERPEPIIDPLFDAPVFAGDGHPRRTNRSGWEVGFGAIMRGDARADTPTASVRLVRTIGEAHCDGLDNDGDGQVDEGTGAGLPCTVDVGVCANPDGRLVCDAEGPRCAGEARDEEQGVEVCDELLDNDCDGYVDEDTRPGEEGPSIMGRYPRIGFCRNGDGACRTLGSFVCNDEGGSECSAEPLPPTPEVCDGVDNDCDERTDEETPDEDGDGLCEGTDASGVAQDNCPGHWNPPPVEGRRQDDTDNDGIGDVCDRYPGYWSCAGGDSPPCNGCPSGILVPAGNFTCIPPGEFEMGAPVNQPLARADERPRQRTVMPDPFIIGSAETTLQDYVNVMGDRPEVGEDCNLPSVCPARGITWFAAAKYAVERSLAEGVPEEQTCYELVGCEEGPTASVECDEVRPRRPCLGYRLPTEAEWEYAALAGAASTWWWGDSETAFPYIDCYFGSCAGEVGRIGAFSSNAISPWDMVHVNGNVREWTESWYSDSHLPPDPETRYPAVALPEDGPDPRRVARGGSAEDELPLCRAAARHPYTPDTQSPYIGLRPVRVAESDPACLDVEMTADVCNGVDDDCDGRVDEDPTLGAEGVCWGGLIGHWPMDEGQGSVVRNRINQHPGWLGLDAKTADDGSTAEPAWVADRCGGTALRLDGDDDFALMPGESRHETDRPTVAIWVRGAEGAEGVIVKRGSANTHVGTYELYSTAEGIIFFVRTADGQYHTSNVLEADSVWDGGWHLIVGTYDGRTLNLYLDGAPVEPVPVVGLLSRPAPAHIYVGTRVHTQDPRDRPYLNADVDDLRIWGRALTPAEVRALADDPCDLPGMAPQCRPGAEPAAEVCNGLDDDCDGRADEGTETVSLGSFDNNAEGWSIVNLTSYAGHPGVLDAGTMTLGPGEVLHLADGGSPGGYIEAMDPSIEEAFQFSAPGEGLGRLRGSGGGVLRFRLRVSHFDDYWESAVHLVGARHALRHVIPSETFGGQADVWHSIEVPLLPSSFVMGVGDEQRPPTPSELEGVLRSPHALMLPGEWSSGGGPETTSIDSVEIERSICGGRE